MTLEVAPNTWLFSCERKEREEEHEIRRRCNSLDDNNEKSTTINTKGILKSLMVIFCTSAPQLSARYKQYSIKSRDTYLCRLWNKFLFIRHSGWRISTKHSCSRALEKKHRQFKSTSCKWRWSAFRCYPRWVWVCHCGSCFVGDLWSECGCIGTVARHLQSPGPRCKSSWRLKPCFS